MELKPKNVTIRLSQSDYETLDEYREPKESWAKFMARVIKLIKIDTGEQHD